MNDLLNELTSRTFLASMGIPMQVWTNEDEFALRDELSRAIQHDGRWTTKPALAPVCYRIARMILDSKTKTTF